jgi:phosphate/sulfate permease
MTNSFDTNEIERRARAASFQDGLMEIFAAVVLTIIAIAWVASPSLVGIAAAFVVLFGWRVVERFKRRITYPRIGYYQERAEDAGKTGRGMLIFIGGAIAIMIGAVAVSGDVTDASEWRRAAPLLSGLTLAGGFWYAGERSGLIRHRVISIYSVVTGVLLWAFSSGATYEPLVWHLLGLALPLMAIGTWALEHFIRTHPLPHGAHDA